MKCGVFDGAKYWSDRNRKSHATRKPRTWPIIEKQKPNCGQKWVKYSVGRVVIWVRWVLCNCVYLTCTCACLCMRIWLNIRRTEVNSCILIALLCCAHFSQKGIDDVSMKHYHTFGYRQIYLICSICRWCVHIFSFSLFHSHSIAIILLINSLMKFQFVYQDFL